MASLPDDELLAPAFEALRSRSWRILGAEPMAGDVSRRRYHRLALEGGGGAVLALYPPDLQEACRRSLATGHLLASVGVRVPGVLAEDCRAGWTLLEDLGERTLYDLEDRPWPELEPYFEAAVAALQRIVRLAPGRIRGLNPPLDARLLGNELRHTAEHLLEPLGLPLPPLELLCRRLGAEEPVPCHRDYGARNLVPLPGTDGERASVGVLDHQDLRPGPPLYDLASLLNDSLFPPPQAEARLLAAAGVNDPEPYHRVAAQRTLKAVGSYAAFARRGDPRHLRLVPPTLERALTHLERTPETAALAPELRELWKPALDPSRLETLGDSTRRPGG